MGHDLGHTPFGHVGEKIINAIMVERGNLHFEHELNSLRVIDFLADNGAGLNLTYAVRDGIASHNGESFLQTITPTHTIKDLDNVTERKGIIPATWEATVVRFSDQIAYVGRDFEDACRLNVITEEMLPDTVRKTLGNKNSKIIDRLVHDIICSSSSEKGISFSDEIYQALVEMKEFNYREIYRSPMLQGYYDYFSRLLHLIVEYLEQLFEQYQFDVDQYQREKNMLSMGFRNYLIDMKEAYIAHDGDYSRVVFDYVAGMSDNFALDCADEILKPTHLNEDIERSLTGKWFDVR